MFDWDEGFLFHPDPDVLVALASGCHGYETIDEAKQAYVEGELSHLEFRATLDWFLEDHHPV